LLHFPKYLQRIAAALLKEAPMNKGFVLGKLPMMRLVDRGARWFHQVFLNGFLFHTQVGGNLSEAVALLMKHLHPLIPSHSSFLRCDFGRIIPFEGKIFAQEDWLRGTQELMNG